MTSVHKIAQIVLLIVGNRQNAAPKTVKMTFKNH